MENQLKKNIDFLKKNYPDIYLRIKNYNPPEDYRLITSPKTNILYRRRSVHSAMAPEKEAENLIKGVPAFKNIIFMFLGLGLGYHLNYFLKLCKNITSSCKVIVIEKDISLFMLMLQAVDITFLKDVTLLVDPALDELNWLFQKIDPVSFSGYRIIRLPGAYNIHRKFYTTVENTFKEIIGSKLADILTRFAFETLWLKNAFENIEHLPESSPLDSLKGSGKNQLSIVVGAGPSLLEQLDLIKELSDKVHIVAVDTAVAPLLKSKIIPDFVVTLDAQYASINDFTHLFIHPSFPYPYLIYDIFSYPGIPKHFKGHRFYTASLNIYSDNTGNPVYVDNPIVTHIKNSVGDFKSLPSGGSVLTNAIELALYLDFDRIYIVGADLSYTDYKTHVNSSPYYHSILLHGNRFKTLELANISPISGRKLIWINNCLSDYVLNNYKNWIEKRGYPEEKVFNSTLKGLKIKTLYPFDLKDLRKLSIIKKPIQAGFKRPDTENVINFLLTTRSHLMETFHTGESFYKKINEGLKDSFFYLTNLVLEAERIYKNSEEKINSYLKSLTGYLLKRIDKALEKLKKK